MKLELYASHYSHLAVRSSKKSRNQETGFGNSGRLKVLTDTNLIPNDIKPGVTHAHLRPIWHHSEPSDSTSILGFLFGTFYHCLTLEELFSSMFMRFTKAGGAVLFVTTKHLSLKAKMSLRF